LKVDEPSVSGQVAFYFKTGSSIHAGKFILIIKLQDIKDD